MPLAKIETTNGKRVRAEGLNPDDLVAIFTQIPRPNSPRSLWINSSLEFTDSAIAVCRASSVVLAIVDRDASDFIRYRCGDVVPILVLDPWPFSEDLYFTAMDFQRMVCEYTGYDSPDLVASMIWEAERRRGAAANDAFEAYLKDAVEQGAK